MSADPPLILSLLWLAWVVQVVYSAFTVRWFSKRVVAPRRGLPQHDQPHAAIVMPVKGLDENLESTVETLCNQDYDDYRVVIVVESQD